MTPVDVVVVGAGCAGLSAASALADAGARVVVAEARPVLGGRTFATRDQASGEWVDNGQHVLFGCYHDTRAFLRRIGADSLVSIQDGLRVAMADRPGRLSELRCPPLASPWNLLAGVLGWSAVSWRDRLSALGMARALGNSEAPPAGQTVREWLIAHGQATALCDLLWEPLAVAALNQPIDLATAAPFAEVIRRLLGPGADDAALILPARSLSHVFVDPAVRFVEGRGGSVRAGAAARITFADGRANGIEIKGERIAAGAVIAAVPWHALDATCGGDAPPGLQATIARASAMRHSPIVTANLWFDRPVLELPFVGLPGRTFQWAFDRCQLTPGESTCVSLVCSGADRVADLSNEAIVAGAHSDLAAALPGVRRVRLLRGAAIRERRATFSLAAGEPLRPATGTAVPGFFLAGDWIDTGLPATIESAVISGHRAARAALACLERAGSATAGQRHLLSRDPLAVSP